MTPRPIRFLDVADVVRLHRLAMLDQGSEPRLRDAGLLESAVAMPMQQFGGAFLHDGIPAMAAAYAFHISSNHPFEDGNKRAATLAMIQFLSDNGWSFDATADEAEPVILSLAAGELDKATLTTWLALHVHEKPSLELREFFERLDPVTHYEHIVAFNAGTLEEQTQSVNEAAAAMPAVRHLHARASQLAADGKAESASAFFAMVSLHVAMYRIAEDMGYEW